MLSSSVARCSELSRSSRAASATTAGDVVSREMMSASPTMIVSGVRSSCETSPRNSSLTASASRRRSSLSRRTAIAWTRSVTSSTVFAMSGCPPW